jgi:hypothetical protein
LWSERSSVAALRSGGPANHEHADRNSVIFAAYGERLFHDPYKAAYSYTDPHWLLRLTSAHTAVLIDGKGHQYHDGHEGTNASWAEAHIVAYEDRKGDLLATSDATEAYRLVLPGVKLVLRTMVFLKPDILLLVDRIRLDGPPLPVQLRFQVDNSDGKGSVTAEGTGFSDCPPVRPSSGLCLMGGGDFHSHRHATASSRTWSAAVCGSAVTTGDRASHLTVCTAQETGKAHGALVVHQSSAGFEITGRHNVHLLRGAHLHST